MRFRPTVTAALLAISSFAAMAQAAGDPQKGAELAVTCLGCHGIEGYRNAYPSYRVPKLGGQNADYIVIALQGYRAHTRPHPTMQANAATLTDENIAHIAAYFASFGEPKTGSAPPPSAGQASEKVALCAACHGEAGISSAPMWPNLAGQHRDYLEMAITRYRDKQRGDPVMQGQAAGLSDADIRALAAYYAAQPGLFTTVKKH